MTENELIYAIVARHGSLLTKRQTTAVIDTMKDIAAKELSAGGEIHLHRFAVLRAQETPARMGRNPRTKEAVEIPAGRRIQFRAGQRLKDDLKAALEAQRQAATAGRRRRG